MTGLLTTLLFSTLVARAGSAQLIIARDANGAPYVRDGESSWITLDGELNGGPDAERDLTLQDSQADVPEAQQRRVSGGDFLMRVGNSGRSFAPHLHIHKQRGRGPSPEPVALSFRGVRYQLIQPDRMRPTLDEDFWLPLNDQPIPPGPVLVRRDP